MDRINKSSAKKVFDIFKSINEVPRESGNEKAISDWLVDFAKDYGLDHIQDQALNVIIKKPGTRGYEEAETVILQGHMDMVAEKAEGSNHNFERDPIDFIIDGDFIRANNTSLGADNGIALAYGLAIISSDDIAHPPLELVFTTEEETGMDGAFALDMDLIKGRRLINLDAEQEGDLYVSCAGGISALTKLDFCRKSAISGEYFEIYVSGLFGGHSGMEIDKQRANAIQVLGRILNKLKEDYDYHLIELNGGSKHNAIPRDAWAGLIFEEYDEELIQVGESWTSLLREELRGIDDDILVEIKAKGKEYKLAMTQEIRDKVLAIINLTPSGVINFNQDIEGLVQTSNNLAIVETKEKEITFLSAIRSSVKSMRDQVGEKLAQLADLSGASIDFDEAYPEWQYNPESRLRKAFIEAYRSRYGENPNITGIHAGLECGIFSEKLGGQIDLIAMGPNLYNVHTPKEKMDIGSVERTYELLKDILALLK